MELNYIKCSVNPSNIVEPVKVNEKFLKFKKSKTLSNFNEGYKYYSGDNFEIFKNTNTSSTLHMQNSKTLVNEVYKKHVQNTNEFIWNTKSYIKNLISPQTIFRNKI